MKGLDAEGTYFLDWIFDLHLHYYICVLHNFSELKYIFLQLELFA